MATFEEYIDKIDIEHAQRIAKVLVENITTEKPSDDQKLILTKMCMDFIKLARQANLELVEKDDFR